MEANRRRDARATPFRQRLKFDETLRVCDDVVRASPRPRRSVTARSRPRRPPRSASRVASPQSAIDVVHELPRGGVTSRERASRANRLHEFGGDEDDAVRVRPPRASHLPTREKAQRAHRELGRRFMGPPGVAKHDVRAHDPTNRDAAPTGSNGSSARVTLSESAAIAPSHAPPNAAPASTIRR